MEDGLGRRRANGRIAINRVRGYIRVLKAGFRHSDNAAMVVIEFVDRDPAEKGKDSGPVMVSGED